MAYTPLLCTQGGYRVAYTTVIHLREATGWHIPLLYTSQDPTVKYTLLLYTSQDPTVRYTRYIPLSGPYGEVYPGIYTSQDPTVRYTRVNNTSQDPTVGIPGL